MLTLEGFMAVVSLCVGCFGLGYTIGKNTKNNRPETANHGGYFYIPLRS